MINIGVCGATWQNLPCLSGANHSGPHDFTGADSNRIDWMCKALKFQDRAHKAEGEVAILRGRVSKLEAAIADAKSLTVMKSWDAGECVCASALASALDV